MIINTGTHGGHTPSSLQRCRTFMLWSIDAYQNKVSSDQHHWGRITFDLFFKASSGVHPFIGKLDFIHVQIFTWKDE